MKTIQSRILNAIEAMVANESHYVCVVVEFANHIDGCEDFVILSKGENWSINSYKFVTPSGKVYFSLGDTVHNVELCKFLYNPDGTKCIADAIAKF